MLPVTRKPTLSSRRKCPDQKAAIRKLGRDAGQSKGGAIFWDCVERLRGRGGRAVCRLSGSSARGGGIVVATKVREVWPHQGYECRAGCDQDADERASSLNARLPFLLPSSVLPSSHSPPATSPSCRAACTTCRPLHRPVLPESVGRCPYPGYIPTRRPSTVLTHPRTTRHHRCPKRSSSHVPGRTARSLEISHGPSRLDEVRTPAAKQRCSCLCADQPRLGTGSIRHARTRYVFVALFPMPAASLINATRQ